MRRDPILYGEKEVRKTGASPRAVRIFRASFDAVAAHSSSSYKAQFMPALSITLISRICWKTKITGERKIPEYIPELIKNLPWGFKVEMNYDATR